MPWVHVYVPDRPYCSLGRLHYATILSRFKGSLGAETNENIDNIMPLFHVQIFIYELQC